MLRKIAVTTVISMSVIANANIAFAQSASTLRSPIISGAPTSSPFLCPAEGPAPAVGDGPTPSPVIPGHTGPSTLLPWIPAVPSNSANVGSSGIPIPFGPPVATAPGVLGPLLTPFVPTSPSAPGPAQPMLDAPVGSVNPGRQININPGGGYPGTGGYNTTIPTVRRGGQETHQWELRGRNSSLIPGMGDGTQDQVTRLGPWAGWGVPFGVATGNGMRNSSIDLGGGMRFKTAGGCAIPTGSSVQDYGMSSTRGNPIQGLAANQAYDFAQGRHNQAAFSSKTTDFGNPYTQFAPANVTGQKTGQRLLPTGVITNF